MGDTSKSIWLATALLLAGAVHSALAQSVTHIDVATPSQSNAAWGGAPPFPEEVEIPLQQADEYSHIWLRVMSRPGSEIQVRAQFETSLAVSTDGKVLELRDFQHCYSDWVLAIAKDQDQYVIPEASEAQQRCVPNSSVSEIRKAIRDELARAGIQDSMGVWSNAMREMKRAGDKPTCAALSRVRVLVEAKERGEWKRQAMLALMVPMEC